MQRWPDRIEAVLRARSEAFFSLESAVRSGQNPEAIHDMRVASRRLQEVLRLVFPDHPDLAGPLRILRRARRVQSRVRDLDVMIARVRGMGRDAKGDTPAALRFFGGRLVGLRKRRLRKMAGILVDLDLARLHVELEGLVARLQDSPDTGLTRTTVQRRAQAHIRIRAEAFRKAVLASREGLASDDLHRARIAGKRLRYAMEIADELRLGGFKKRIALLRDIQQSLGRWHDLEVLEETIAGLTATRSMFQRRLPVVRATCGLIAGWREEKRKLVQEYLHLTRGI